MITKYLEHSTYLIYVLSQPLLVWGGRVGRTRVDQPLSICRDIRLFSDGFLELQHRLISRDANLELQLARTCPSSLQYKFICRLNYRRNIPLTLTWISEDGPVSVDMMIGE